MAVVVVRLSDAELTLIGGLRNWESPPEKRAEGCQALSVTLWYICDLRCGLRQKLPTA